MQLLRDFHGFKAAKEGLYFCRFFHDFKTGHKNKVPRHDYWRQKARKTELLRRYFFEGLTKIQKENRVDF